MRASRARVAIGTSCLAIPVAGWRAGRAEGLGLWAGSGMGGIRQGPLARTARVSRATGALDLGAGSRPPAVHLRLRALGRTRRVYSIQRFRHIYLSA